MKRMLFVALVAATATAKLEPASAQQPILQPSDQLIAIDVAEIQSEQRGLHQRTEAIQPETLGRDYKDLTVQQQTDLQNLTAAQADLARRFDKLGQRMEQMQAKFRETAPLAADSLADAVELVRQQAIASDMRDSARFVEDNRLGQSLDRQKVIDAKLDELLDKEQEEFDAKKRRQYLSQAMSILTEEAPACFMWRHKLLWGLSNKVDYKPLPDGRIYGVDMKVKK